jgi:hypothetical protein
MRRTSSIVVDPSRTFETPLSRSVTIPAAIACLRISSVVTCDITRLRYLVVGEGMQWQLVRPLAPLSATRRNRRVYGVDPLACLRTRRPARRRCLKQRGTRPMGVRPGSHDLADHLDLVYLRLIRLDEPLLPSHRSYARMALKKSATPMNRRSIDVNDLFRLT